ncbi:MAG: 4'-phosphopantetheinyl transferase superfamily protein [Butyrivibrio sp.]|nr:4'-phosphopantetheinyl transferase superfamily protein [Butyrivibrio sp.]
MNVYYCNVGKFIKDTSFFDNNPGKYFQLIDNERLEKIDRYKNHPDKVRALFAGILIQLALKDHLNKNYYTTSEAKLSEILYPKDIIQVHYTPNAYGKPFIMSYPDFHFSLSHSGDYVALASNDAPVGLDIQEEQNKKVFAISARFFAPKENELLESIADKEERLKMFYRIWSAKEAYIKYTGRGIYENLSSFTIDLEGKIVTDTVTNTTTGYLCEPLTLIRNSSVLCIGQEIQNVNSINIIL